jgi:transcription elongation factor Elf1
MTTHELTQPRTDDQPGTDDTPPKATLFCPNCGHQGRIDGDWTVVKTDTQERLECPACETSIPVGSTAETSQSDESLAAVSLELWERNRRTWERFRQRVFAPGD